MIKLGHVWGRLLPITSACQSSPKLRQQQLITSLGLLVHLMRGTTFGEGRGTKVVRSSRPVFRALLPLQRRCGARWARLRQWRLSRVQRALQRALMLFFLLFLLFVLVLLLGILRAEAARWVGSPLSTASHT